MTVNPIRFGPPFRQLFGLYEAPADDIDVGRGVLICNPFGQEAIRCHRLLRVLGDRLVRNGFHVLRFDYFGTGDSDGDDLQGDVPAWVQDILLAHAEIIQRGDVQRVSWFGLRLGATLAAVASARASPPPERLVLWDPVIDGARYLDELAKAHAAELTTLDARPGMDSAPASPDPTEAFGFPISAALHEQLAGVSAASFAASRAAQICIVSATAAAQVEQLGRVPARSHSSLRAKAIAGHIVWASGEALNVATVPVEEVQTVVAALIGDP